MLRPSSDPSCTTYLVGSAPSKSGVEANFARFSRVSGRDPPQPLPSRSSATGTRSDPPVAKLRSESFGAGNTWSARPVDGCADTCCSVWVGNADGVRDASPRSGTGSARASSRCWRQRLLRQLAKRPVLDLRASELRYQLAKV